MNDLQKRTAQAIVNIFETGRVAGDYGAVTLLPGDAGHLTYGRSQTTLGSGNLFLLIKAYCERADAGFANELRPFLADLCTRNADLDRNMQLREMLHQAGSDPAMRNEQDRFFSAHYFTPAVNTAQARGVTLPLGQVVVYDSFIQGGFRKVTPLVGTSIGPGGVDEREWIQKYVAARKSWLSGLKSPLPGTIYRMEAFESLIGGGAWDLALNLTVRGVVISPESLDDSTVIMRADPSPDLALHARRGGEESAGSPQHQWVREQPRWRLWSVHGSPGQALTRLERTARGWRGGPCRPRRAGTVEGRLSFGWTRPGP
jgi:chitosanase